MNATTEPETESPGKWGRMARLPIPLLLGAIIAARMAGLHAPHESHTLLLALSLTFYTLASLGTLFLIGRSFLASGSPGLLLLECGVVLWSLAGTVGDFVSHGDANINVTIFNVGILLAGLCHLTGAILALSPQRVLRMKPAWLGGGCALALGALWLVAQAALSGWLPAFFIPGHGGTLVRYLVLLSAIAMFVLSAAVLHANKPAARLPFTYWYTLALLLLAVGLFGIMIQLSLGSVVNWLSRTAQWLGGTYLLFAAIASLRESRLPLLPQERKSQPAYYRYAVAVAVVLASAAIRFAFLSAMNTQAPFLVFFPAVTFAAIYGGLGPGLVATATAVTLVDYFWIEPLNQFGGGRPSAQIAMGIFVLCAAMVAWISDSMQRARSRSSAAEAQALLAAERIKAAEALYEGRAKLEAALASMTDAVFISDTQGRFLHLNDACAAYYRFRNKDECLKTIAEYPHILEAFMADGKLVPLEMWAVPRALRGETGTNTEYALRRKDTGETWTGSYSFAPIRNPGGAIVGSVVVARDVTERKRTEEKLRENQVLLNTIMENTPDPVYVKDDQSRIIMANPALAKVIGKPLNEIIGRTDSEYYVDPNTGQALREHDLRVLKSGHNEITEETVSTPDGYRTFLSTKTPYRNASGDIIGITGISHDITERKRAEEALRESENRYRGIVETAEEGIATHEPDGTVSYVNQRMADMLGYSRREIIGRSSLDFVDGEEWEAVIRLRESVQGQGSFSAEWKLRRKDGSFLWTLSNVSPRRDDGGNFIGYLAMHTDITARKAAYDTLRRQAEQLERSRQAALNLARDATAAHARTKEAEEALKKAYAELEKRIRERTRDLREAQRYAEGIVETVREPLVVLDADLKVISANSAFYKTFKVTPHDTEKHFIYEIGNRHWNIPRLRALLEGILPENTQFQDFEVDYEFSTIGRKTMLLNARRIYQEDKRTQMILLALEDITERKDADEALRKAHEQVQFFASQCLTAQETERKRVAGELHDSISASLSAMRFRIDKAAEEMKGGHGHPQSLQDLGSKVAEINNEVRRIMADLRPSILDDLGIISAMNWFCREYRKTYSQIAVENQIGVSESEVPDSLKTPIFRISQEAMNNIAKYSQASLVNLSLRKEDRSILLTIQDNGQGFDPGTVRKGMGLSTMKERAQFSGGTFHLESARGKGTVIRATWNI